MPKRITHRKPPKPLPGEMTVPVLWTWARAPEELDVLSVTREAEVKRFVLLWVAAPRPPDERPPPFREEKVALPRCGSPIAGTPPPVGIGMNGQASPSALIIAGQSHPAHAWSKSTRPDDGAAGRAPGLGAIQGDVRASEGATIVALAALERLSCEPVVDQIMVPRAHVFVDLV